MRTTSQTWLGQILLGALLLAGILVAPQAASAADSCDDTVVDTTAANSLDTAKIESASTRLQNEGADVRVRAFQNAPGGSLDRYLKNQVAACDSWQDNSGAVLKGNMIVFLFSMDHKSAIFFGSNWHGELDSRVDGILANDMNENLRAGKFTDSITESEAGVYDALTGASDQSGSQSSGPTVSTGAAKAFGKVVLIILAVGLLIAAGFLLVSMRNRARERERQRQLAYAAATEKVDKAIMGMGSLNLLNATNLYQIAVTDLNEADSAQLTKLKDRVAADYGQALNAELPVLLKEATRDECDAASQSADGVLALVTTAQASITEFEEQCNQFIDKIQRAPAQLTELEEQYTALMQAQAELAQQGYRHEESKVLQTVRTLLDEATRQIQAKHYGQALDELDKSSELCSEVNGRLTKLRNIRSEQASRSIQLMAALTGARQQVADGSATLAFLRNHYDSSCWQDLSREQDEAVELCDDADRALRMAGQFSTMESQRWDTAADQLDSAKQAIRGAQKFPELAESRVRELEDLVQNTSDAMSLLLEDITQAREDIAELRGKQKGRLDKLKEIQITASDLDRRLYAPTPKYFEIAESIKALKQSVADILKKAQAAHDKIVAEERREAREAAAARNRSSSYGSDNSFATGYVMGGLTNSNTNYGGGGGGGFDFGGGASGGWGGGDAGGGASGGW
jgi:uncharacterized membrane protein YgcG